MSDHPTEDSFLKDVRDHVMTIVVDNGKHRHIKFSRPDSTTYAFEIVTFPGHLVYTGDMGAFVFKRTPDMFEFFRRTPTNDRGLPINLDYWAEKVVAETVPDGAKRWSAEKFRQNVRDYVEGYMDLPKGFTEFPKEVAEDLEPIMDAEDEHTAIAAVQSFVSDHLDFDEFWECSADDFTYYFVWCCLAIVWAIHVYDTAKGEKI